ncbi:MAG: hypothetical protein DCF19_21580 [Pseudanabaena frigida]|uniref:Filamentous haemagglutinin FhaB/tRNA nuclease CdiA-like TPS domain-containing protein n=1 Tax=Pseudanabaena frigida TaxID=945775 RepID=A0A2W4VU44_9CYAN|nr:MAG: hypothetical protein DCF19_21580 [Pseudanabaena frigida]
MSTVFKIGFKYIKRVAIALLLTHPFVVGSAAYAQSIVPANDLGTQVNSATTNSQQLNITGGTQAGINLYHSFQQFGLEQGQIANFLSNPSIQNILGRVVGGNPSIINGLIQVTGGNSNLYLLNPAGIIFGSNASLNVPAAFTATTANGIQVGNGWFGLNTGIDDVKKLTGTPQAFGFASNTSMTASDQPVAAIINTGNLTTQEGQSITLVGGLVINTGTIASPSGKVTIAAVPDGKYVKITPEGSLLSLELPIADQQELAQRSILTSDLPSLLRGSTELRNLTGLNVDSSGNVLVGNTAIPATSGTAIASGTIDVSSSTAKGGEINVLGDRVGLVSANVNASGAIGGGTVLIGGDYLGKGVVPNSQITFVDRSSTINADAMQSGNGGKVIAWADDKTSFSGKISVRGGINGGNGGFVETSGKNYLNVQNASVDASAANGKIGSWLLDPRNIIIQTGGTTVVADPLILTKLADASDTTNDFTIDPSVISGATANVTLVASNDITFNNSISNFNDNVTLTAISGNQIKTISGVNVSFFGLNSGINFSANGDITIAPKGTNFFSRAIEASNISLTSTNGNISTGSIRATDSTPIGSQVVLTANNGSILLDGFIQAGDSNNATTDSKITITAQRFTAINPLSFNANYVNVGDTTGFINNGQQNPTSLIAYAAFTTDPVGTFTGAPVRSIQLQLPGDTAPRTIAGSGASIISINILKDTTFSIYPKAIASGTSGTSGAISQGVSSIPPNVLVLISDQSFSSNTNTSNNTSLANALTANTLSNDAIASARTADLQANAGEVKDCEQTGTKKPILNLTASVPSATVTRNVQNPKRSNLPPCKE